VVLAEGLLALDLVVGKRLVLALVVLVGNLLVLLDHRGHGHLAAGRHVVWGPGVHDPAGCRQLCPHFRTFASASSATDGLLRERLLLPRLIWWYALREPHINVFLGLGVHEQHAVLARLLDHAHVEIVPLGAPLLGLGVLVHHTGEERAVAVGVLRQQVNAISDGDPKCRPQETLLFTNKSALLFQACGDSRSASEGRLRAQWVGGRTPMGSFAGAAWPWAWCSSWA
jgi:hypothetical protein